MPAVTLETGYLQDGQRTSMVASVDGVRQYATIYDYDDDNRLTVVHQINAGGAGRR